MTIRLKCLIWWSLFLPLLRNWIQLHEGEFQTKHPHVPGEASFICCHTFVLRAWNSVAETDSCGNESHKSLNKIFSKAKKSTSILFFLWKLRWTSDLWMQIEGRKLMFIVNFSVLDLIRFASRMPQITQILVSTFKHFPGEYAPPGPL